MQLEDIAQICHEANRALCESAGDFSQKSWADAEAWQQESAVNGVVFALAHPDAPASAQHDAWMKDKLSDGWAYGPVKDATAKTHPCIVPYTELPPVQQAKDHLFKAIVNALCPFVEPRLTQS